MFIANIIYFIARLLNSTYRYRFMGLENITQAQKLSKHGNYLLGIWHQNLLHGILAQRGNPHIVIVSRSKDADPVAYTCKKIGTIVVRGSSRNKAGVDKGGKAAKEEMIEKLCQAHPGAVTIDGPKGPAKEVKPGIVDMAIKSETTIIPYLPIAEKFWSFNSWDKFRLPKLFTRIIVCYGSPIAITTDRSFESYQMELKQSLDEIESKVRDNFKNWTSLEKRNWNQKR
ncbi:lysophospholipid acyltransferase family protein [Halobacteriovorax sp. HLS]|uniref:lysophospholipid acyltransferase family protein n=1 Tax=Halobacteriovorax sp. HLS TaxID=2234000 RepID=UPI000FDA9C03|nr:DUF374 domain-containing protein [Halobacteriovorax sp. HLS]